jgi:hypothetical protein
VGIDHRHRVIIIRGDVGLEQSALKMKRRNQEISWLSG